VGIVGLETISSVRFADLKRLRCVVSAQRKRITRVVWHFASAPWVLCDCPDVDRYALHAMRPQSEVG